MPRFVPLVVLLCLAVIGALALVPAALPPAGSGASSAGGGDFDRRVRAYLMEHPEVIMEAVAGLERRRSVARAEGQRRAARANSAVLAESAFLPVAGNPVGDVTVVEFFDYRCPYCRRAVPELQALIAADRGVRVVYREFPVLGPQSILAARAAVAAHFQGRYLTFHDALMGVAGELDEEAILATAAASGLDVARLRADMERPEVGDTIAEAHELAARLGINATPTFVIGDEVVPGYVDVATLRRLVNAARAAR